MSKITTLDVASSFDSSNGDSKITRAGAGNIYMKKPTRSMLFDEYVDPATGEANERFDRNYVKEKVRREYIVPLDFENKEEYIAFFEESWEWYQQTAERERQAQLAELTATFEKDEESLKALIANAQKMLDDIKARKQWQG